jgi:hypothetical protein
LIEPFTDREARQLQDEWEALHRLPIRYTRAWRSKRAELLPKLRAQIAWENRLHATQEA